MPHIAREFCLISYYEENLIAMHKNRPVQKLNGHELFKSADKSFSVLDFWQYAFSSLNSNVLRGALAEFLVETALRDVADIGVRNPWGDYDLLTPAGEKVEVKCAAYLQDWDQKELSRIVWTGLKAKELYWSSAVNTESDSSPADYKADLYVLAMVHHTDPKTLDLLDLRQWSFFVLTRDELKRIARNGSSVSLSRLKEAGQKPISYNALSNRLAATPIR